MECFGREEAAREAVDRTSSKTTTTTPSLSSSLTETRTPRIGTESFCDASDELPPSADLSFSTAAPTTSSSVVVFVESSSPSLLSPAGVVDPWCSAPCGRGYMFRSRRVTLVKRLWKTRLRATTGVVPQTPTGGTTRCAGGDGSSTGNASGCYEYCGIGRPVESGDRSGDEGTEDESSSDAHQSLLSKSQVFAFLDQLDVGQLEGLLAAVRTGAEEATACVMVGSNVRLSGSLVGIPPALVCGLLWRWPKARLNQLCLRKLPFCECTDSECFATGSSVDSLDGGGRNSNVYICCNPYHWSIRTLPGRRQHVHLCVSCCLDAMINNFVGLKLFYVFF